MLTLVCWSSMCGEFQIIMAQDVHDLTLLTAVCSMPCNAHFGFRIVLRRSQSRLVTRHAEQQQARCVRQA